MKLLKWPRQHKWLTFLAIVALVVFGFFAYEKVALELNRRAFQATSHGMTTIYNRVVDHVGEPDDNRIRAYCETVQMAWGDGPTSCSIDTSFIYPTSDKVAADNLRERIRSVLNSSSEWKFVSQREWNANISGSDSEPVNDYYEMNTLQCVVSYIFNPTFDSSLRLKKQGDNHVFFIDMNCSGPAQDSYFQTF